MEPKGKELIQRYKKNYCIPEQVNISESMVLEHWELEKKLTSELLNSSTEDRWSTFESCYTRLFSEIYWLNNSDDDNSSLDRLKEWENVLSEPQKLIYEIGSGKGKLISHLSKNGFVCKGSEITHERGKKHVPTSGAYKNLSWGISDGVHLDRFEPPEKYDVVISDQVIEHLHPEDLTTHLKSVKTILKTGGKYIFSTPHLYTGPHDISKVFKHTEPKGMHLKEYTYKSLKEAVNQADFNSLNYAIKHKRTQGLLNFFQISKQSMIGIQILDLFLFEEKVLSKVSNHSTRRLLCKVLKSLKIFTDDIFLVAYKQ